MVRSLFRLLGGLGRAVVPLGLFAVIAVGLHAGADRVDDYVLVALNAADEVFDVGASAFVRWALEGLGFTAATVNRWTYDVVELVDIDTKDWLARAFALVVELLGDLVFAVPLFFHRERDRPYREMAKNLYQDPTVLRFVAPLTAGLASVAGVLTIARELSVAGHAAIDGVGGPARSAELGAAVTAGVVLALVLWRLGAVTVARAICWADRVGEGDRARQVPARRRRLRGWVVMLLVLPVSVLAVVEAVPVVPTLRALFAVAA